MATLTEKEFEISLNGLLKASVFATLRNGVVDEIYVTLDLDGFHVIWSPLHKNGMIRIYEIGKFTHDYRRMESLICGDFKTLDQAINKFLSENKTYK